MGFMKYRFSQRDIIVSEFTLFNYVIIRSIPRERRVERYHERIETFYLLMLPTIIQIDFACDAHLNSGFMDLNHTNMKKRESPIRKTNMHDCVANAINLAIFRVGFLGVIVHRNKKCINRAGERRFFKMDNSILKTSLTASFSAPASIVGVSINRFETADSYIIPAIVITHICAL